jgi:hypothetical protein
MKLLFRTAEWHGFAKMRMHTDSTLKHLDNLTTELGKLVRDFETSTCLHFTTVELPREMEARQRRKGHTSGASESTAGGRRARSLNLFTYKWHSLGDYVPSIRLFGGTDGISTQIVSSSSAIINLADVFPGRTRPSPCETTLQADKQAQSREANWEACSPSRDGTASNPSP